MARGPKPAPAAVKAQKAAVRSVRKSDEAQAETAAPVLLGPTPPAWLKGAGAEVWDRLAPTLAGAKLLSVADSETFARYCRNFARWLKLQDELDADGETYETSSEHMKGVLKRANPAFLIADRLERQLLAAEDRFGLNPAERQRIFAARSQTGVSGDLFDNKPPARKPGDPATPAAEPAQPVDSPVGLLN